MNYDYTWMDAEQTHLRRGDADGNVAYIPVDPGNADYVEFLASGVAAVAYVAPPTPPEPTAEEKLQSAGLTVEELQTLLGL